MAHYIEMKDKVLWEGQQMVGEITVPNLSEYETIAIYTRYGSFITHTGRGTITGIHCDWNSSQKTMPVTHHIYGSISGDKLNIMMCNFITHIASSGHSANAENILYISRIIGLEPKKSVILEKIGGGGVSNLKVSLLLGGVRHAKTVGHTLKDWTVYKGEQSRNSNEGLHDVALRQIYIYKHFDKCSECTGGINGFVNRRKHHRVTSGGCKLQHSADIEESKRSMLGRSLWIQKYKNLYKHLFGKCVDRLAGNLTSSWRWDYV